MKNNPPLLIFQYVAPIALLFAGIYRVFQNHPAYLVALFIGRGEVVVLWVLLLWLFISVAYLLVSGRCSGLSRVSRKEWIILGLILMIGFYLRAFVAPQTHRLYFDEDIYLNVAQNIQSSQEAMACDNGQVEFGKFICDDPILNKEPSGWPFFLSLVLNFSENPEKAGRFLSLVWSTSIILFVFLLGKLLFNGDTPLWAAGVYSVMPTPIQFAPTLEPNTPFLFWVCVVLIFLVLALKKQDKGYLYPFFPALLFTLQMRPEALLLLPLIVLLIVSERSVSLFQNRPMWLSYLFFVIFLIPHLTHLSFVRHENWGSVHGPTFGVRYFWDNFKVNALYFFQYWRFPLIDTCLAFIGIASLKGNRRNSTLLVGIFATFFLFYLFFYAGSFNYGVDARFSILLHLPMALLAALGISRLKEAFPQFKTQIVSGALALICFFLFFELSSIHILGREGWQSREDHDFIARIASSLPSGAAIFSRVPSQSMVLGLRGVQSWRLDDENLRNQFEEEHRPIYFYYDSWCAVMFKDLCNQMLKTYDFSKAISSTTLDRTLTLYKFNGKKIKNEH